jgi:hypothetical protein
MTRRMSTLWVMNANTRITPPEHLTQNGPGIAPGAVSFFTQRINDQAVTPFAFSTYSSIWLKFRYL